MNNIRLQRSLTASAVLAALIAPAATATTPIEQMVMYTIEDQDHKLYRFVFASNTFQEIGVCTVKNGGTTTNLEDNEAMSFIPTGPDRGFYTSSNSTAPGWMKQRLIKLNAVDATATIYPYPGGPSTFIGYIRGSTPFKDATGKWYIYGSQTRSSGTECRLVVIDPATGLLVGPLLEIRDSADPTKWVVCEGLALDAAGNLFGTEHLSDGAGKRSQLWVINRANGRATRVGGRTPWHRIESLEFAFGDNTPSITGLPAPADTWPATNGVLLGYSDNDDAFLIINPANGATVNFTTIDSKPIAFKALDIECMVFLTQLQDSAGNLTGGYD